MTIKEELINTPYRDSCVIPSITPQILEEKYKEYIDEQNMFPRPNKYIDRTGWICPKCGSSNSPDIFFCPKCPILNKHSSPEEKIHQYSFTCELKNDDPKATI